MQVAAAPVIPIDVFLERLAEDTPAPPARADAPVLVFAGPPAEARRAAAAAARRWQLEHPDARVVPAAPPAHWPFCHPPAAELPASAPILVWAEGLDEAFANAQVGGVRLVTTQPGWLLAAWLGALDTHGCACLVTTADASRLLARAPEAQLHRGPWRRVALAVLDDPGRGEAALESDAAREGLPAAFRTADPVARLRRCLDALAAQRHAGTLMAAGSALVETGDMDTAQRLLDEAVAAAPDCAAAHYELGKLWLRRDELARAAAAFEAAARLAPGFAPAAANLGAALGEIGRTDEALAAFERARAADPDSEQALNNLGVLYRETGRLAESEAALRRLIALVPDLAFAHYNLGHTLFLQGRYQAAVSAYRQGQTLDAGRNPVQASRLAIAQLAAGDAPGALEELRRSVAPLPGDYRTQVLADTQAVVFALLTHRPDLPGWKLVAEWIDRELHRVGP